MAYGNISVSRRMSKSFPLVIQTLLSEEMRRHHNLKMDVTGNIFFFLICVSFIAKHVEHFSYIMAICISSFGKCLFRSLTGLFGGLFGGFVVVIVVKVFMFTSLF